GIKIAMLRRTIFPLMLALAGLIVSSLQAAPKKVILVTTTAGFRHSSIPYARATLAKLAESSGAFVIAAECVQPDIAVPRKPARPKDVPADADEAAKKRYANDLKRYESEIAKWTPQMEADMKAKQKLLDEGMAKALEKLSPSDLKKN